ncbi:TPA: hypothetical protein ACNVDX_003487, partial [Citrobacter gillenii]
MKKIGLMLCIFGMFAISLYATGAVVKTNTQPVTGHKPEVSPVLSHSDLSYGDTLTVDTHFSDPDGDPEDTSPTGTSYQWVTEEQPGVWQAIPGETGPTYVVATAKKKIAVKVTPRTSAVNTEPFVGNETMSDYGIWAALPVSAHSAISLDKTTYAVGDEISVEVVLKDAQDNPVSGKETWLAANLLTIASLKGHWSETALGVYAAKYEVSRTGKSLSLLLGMADGNLRSAYYEVISGGSPVIANSTISMMDTTTPYQAGKQFNITVKLKDAKGRPSHGEYETMLDTSVTLPNATMIHGWVESGAAGEYFGRYITTQSGKGLTATLNLNDGSKQSDPYEVIADVVSVHDSVITVDARAYQVGDTIPVRVELKDKYKNPVLDADLTQKQKWVSATVRVENAELSGSWKDNGNGVYTSDWKAMDPGDGLKASLIGRPGTAASSLYSITGMAVSTNSTFTVKSQTYFIGDDISAEIVLKDAKNNPVTGQEAWIENNIMSPFPLKNAWSETAPGVYVAKYEADNKINDGVMVLDMEGGGIASNYFQIVPAVRGTPVIANSTIQVDDTTGAVGGTVVA